MKKTLLMLTFLSVAPLNAILSPLNESIVEYKALINDSRLASIMKNQDPIESIERTKNKFVIRTSSQAVEVKIIYHPTQMIGPQKFELVFPK